MKLYFFLLLFFAAHFTLREAYLSDVL